MMDDEHWSAPSSQLAHALGIMAATLISAATLASGRKSIQAVVGEALAILQEIDRWEFTVEPPAIIFEAVPWKYRRKPE